VVHPSHQPHLADETPTETFGVESPSRILGSADGRGIGRPMAAIPEHTALWDRPYRLSSLPSGHTLRRAAVVWTFLISGRESAL
jgi:hypothetical protein